MKKKTEPAQPDIAKMSAKLRLQACALLRLDPEKLSPGDEVLVARVGALKLLVSDLEAAQLRGEKIDAAEYVKASEALETAVRADHRMSDEGGSSVSLEEARAKMRAIIKGLQPELVEEAERSEAEILQARVDQLEQENTRLRVLVPEPPPLGRSRAVAVIFIVIAMA
jgi:hypothetical protein